MKILCGLFLVLLTGHLAGQTLEAINDTVDLVPGIPVTVNLLANDTIPAGDSISVRGGTSFTQNLVRCTWKNKGWFTFVAQYWGYDGISEGTYNILDVPQGLLSTARIVCRIHDHSYDSLTVNNIDAAFNASGMNFLLFFADPNGKRGFVVPKGSGKKTIFSNSIWIGGLDQDSNIYVAGERYRQGNFYLPGTHPDYYAGPVMDSANYSIYQDTLWNYIWNLKKTDIDYHKIHWQEPGYQPIKNILTWPGNGDVNLGQAAQLAPYYDRKLDGIYNPMDGDYPQIRGDQALYFIFNENRGPHMESGGSGSMKAEFQAMAYAWDMPGDSAFYNTLFINYKIFNRSQRTYYDTYLGIYSDIDLGNPLDDYIGCDVYRGSYFGYNGTMVDGNGQPYAYGAHPPAQSVTFLAGPKFSPTGTDRPRTDEEGHQLCNESINGTGFGDGIPDNERMGLNNFMWLAGQYSGAPAFMNDPVDAPDYYDYLRNVWLDSTELIYGGLGHLGFGGYGPQCRYIFPGESDTLNWGAGCQPPNGQKNWTEKTAENEPGDRRGLGSVGPFTFYPGEMKELDLVFVFARDYTSPDTLASITKMMQMIDVVRNAFITNKLPSGGSFTMIPEQPAQTPLTCNVFPNPATSRIFIVFDTPLKEKTILQLINDQGKVILSCQVNAGITGTHLDLGDMTVGLYLMIIRSSHTITTKKLSFIR